MSNAQRGVNQFIVRPTPGEPGCYDVVDTLTKTVLYTCPNAGIAERRAKRVRRQQRRQKLASRVLEDDPKKRV